MVTYSTSETSTGNRWINGHTIYRKVLPFAVGPEDGTPTIMLHGIVGGFKLVQMYGAIYTPDGFVQFPLPFINYLNFSSIQLELIGAEVILRTDAVGGQYIDYQGHVVLEYVKVS